MSKSSETLPSARPSETGSGAAVRDLAFFALLLFTLVAYSAAHLHSMGVISPTLDEQIDLWVAGCYVRTGSLAACQRDITQAPLPFYIHAWAGLLFGPALGRFVHYFISYAAGLLTLMVLVFFALKEFGRKVAALTLVLTAASIPLLTSSRMLLTHGNAIFCLLSTATLISSYYFLKTTSWRSGLATAGLFGLTLSSNLLGFSLLIFFVVYPLLNFQLLKQTWLKLLCLVLLSVGIFLLAAPYYVRPGVLPRLAYGLLFWRPLVALPHYNYFLLGSSVPPWWFGLMTFAAKLGPAWILIGALCFGLSYRPLRQLLPFRFFTSLFVAFFAYLILTACVYKNHAPHHQIHFYPFVYLACAYFIVSAAASLRSSRARRLLPAALALAFLLQLHDLYRFFPNYLFYGAQYGDRFVGEFYGPAVFQCQDTDKVKQKILELVGAGETVLDVTRCFKRYSPNLIYFDQRDQERHYRYVLASHIDLHVLTPLRSARYRTYLEQERCREVWVHPFPAGYHGYSIYECRGRP